jgi:hypothetical protein
VLGNWTVIDRIYYTWRELPKPHKNAKPEPQNAPEFGQTPIRRPLGSASIPRAH